VATKKSFSQYWGWCYGMMKYESGVQSSPAVRLLTESQGRVHTSAALQLPVASRMDEDRRQISTWRCEKRYVLLLVGRSVSEYNYFWVDAFAFNTLPGLVGNLQDEKSADQKLLKRHWPVLDPDSTMKSSLASGIMIAVAAQPKSMVGKWRSFGNKIRSNNYLNPRVTDHRI